MWCDGGAYPRILTEMIHGKREERCACFAERGWSELRRLYPACAPDAHRCNTSAAPIAAARGIADMADEAAISAEL